LVLHGRITTLSVKAGLHQRSAAHAMPARKIKYCSGCRDMGRRQNTDSFGFGVHTSREKHRDGELYAEGTPLDSSAPLKNIRARAAPTAPRSLVQGTRVHLIEPSHSRRNPWAREQHPLTRAQG
jgi:hypothetical protein